MEIQIITDHTIGAHQALRAEISEKVKEALRLFSSHITRVEVHLTDENGTKTGPNDKRCVMEARLEGRQPIAVTHDASSLNQAVDGAAGALARLIENTLGRLHDQRSRRNDPVPPGPEPAENDEPQENTSPLESEKIDI